MSSVKIEGNASGTGIFTIASPNSNTNRTQNLPDAAGTIVLDTATQTLTNKTLGSGLVAGASLLTSGTAITLTNQTAPEFTGIPSWVKRITFMLNGVSTNGTSQVQIQLGDSGGYETSGYTGVCLTVITTAAYVADALPGAGFRLETSTGSITAAAVRTGHVVLTNISGNIWIASSVIGNSGNTIYSSIAGTKTLSDTLDRIRLTTVNGTDQFDAGSINILYE